jgi:glyoxylase-like metal-dependent hydrolase (beta-lactamase superfamily II)
LRTERLLSDRRNTKVTPPDTHGRWADLDPTWPGPETTRAPGAEARPPTQESVEQIRRLKALAADRDYRLIPGHDPVVWPALTTELADRFGRTPAR